MGPQSVVTMEISHLHLYVLACAHPNLDGLCADVRAGFTLGGPILTACTLYNALHTADLRGRPRRIAELAFPCTGWGPLGCVLLMPMLGLEPTPLYVRSQCPYH